MCCTGVPRGGIAGGPAVGSPVGAGPGIGAPIVQPTPLLSVTAGPASLVVRRDRSALWLALGLAAVVVLAGRR